MNLTGRVVLTVTIAIVLLTLGVASAVWALVIKPDAILVGVVEKGWHGDRVSVAIPAGPVEAVVKVAVLGHCQGIPEVEEWRPALESIAASLNGVQNATLVAVTTDDESVRILKQNGELRIEVDTDDARVHVNFPASTTKAIFDAISDI